MRENLHFAWSAETGDSGPDAGIDRIAADFPRLIPLLDRQGGVLSGGEQQILAVARCLIADPVLFLLDEPTEGIQPSIIEEMAETLAAIRASRGLTLLLVEQNLEFLTRLSDRILVLERGAVKAEIGREQFGATGLIEEFAGLGGGTASARPAPASAAHRNAAPQPARPQAPPAGRPAALPPAQVRTEARPAPQNPPAQPIGNAMTVRRPTLDQMREIVRSFGMSMSDGEIQSFLDLMEPTLAAYDRVDALRDSPPKVKYPRTPGYRPGDNENPMNAWYYKCEVRGAPGGKLDGKTVALKDNVCLAGVPMMNGASTLEGYIPDLDATIVTRMLDAGATIVGKAHCEYFCLSGGSHTNASAPVHNPWKIGHTAGGSSSGSGALVGAGEVDMAIGGDQGGSIRIPASFSGCYGMKPTHGLVPYTGVMPIEPTIDHTGPMTGNVSDNALLLEVIAGEDGLDPRQYKPRVDDYTKALGRGAGGMRIGVVPEGFGWDNSEPGVDAKVRAAAERFRAMGRDGRGNLDPDAPGWRGDLDPGRSGRRDQHDDARQRLRHELEGPLRHQPARRPCQLALAGRRAVPQPQNHHDDRRIHAEAPSRALFRQVAESGPAADRRLRRCAAPLRPAADADPADGRAADSRPGCNAGVVYSAGVRDDCQHVPVRHHGTSGHEHPVRPERRPARRPDADRQAL